MAMLKDITVAIGVTESLEFFKKDIHNTHRTLMLGLVFLEMSVFLGVNLTSNLHYDMLEETTIHSKLSDGT